MTQEEQIKQVAEYSGANLYNQEDYYSKIRLCVSFASAHIKPPKTTDPRFIESLEYDTSLDWINPVFITLMKELESGDTGVWWKTYNDYHNAIDTGNISQALTAVSDAITWLKEQKVNA